MELPKSYTAERTLTETSGRPARPLLHADGQEDLRSDWRILKLRFVDDPRGAIGDAERRIRDVIDEVHARLLRECDLIGAGVKVKKASTEDLRERFVEYEAILARLGVHVE